MYARNFPCSKRSACSSNHIILCLHTLALCHLTFILSPQTALTTLITPRLWRTSPATRPPLRRTLPRLRTNRLTNIFISRARIQAVVLAALLALRRCFCLLGTRLLGVERGIRVRGGVVGSGFGVLGGLRVERVFVLSVFCGEEGAGGGEEAGGGSWAGEAREGARVRVAEHYCDVVGVSGGLVVCLE
jgi:hypothetical protein